MGQAFYRKYRSKSLTEVVGQEHITDTLKLALQNNATSHAYLFTGPRGVGKTSVARILAHEINKLPYSEESQHLDIIEIDAASNRRIDDVRDLRDKVHIAPVSAAYKVYIIDEVHMLTGESFNALLKTLEEPPAHVVFILATTESHKLPATIVSRTQRFHFRPASIKQVIDHLRSIAKQEKITIEEGALQLIAEHGDGSFRDSVSLLDQLASMSGKTISASFVESSLGLASSQEIDALVTSIQRADRKKLHTDIVNLEDRGVSAQVLTTQLIKALKQKSLEEPRYYSLIETLLEVPKSSNPPLKLLISLLLFAVGDQELIAPKKRVATSAAPFTTHTVKRSPDSITVAPPAVVKPYKSLEKEVSLQPKNEGASLSFEHWSIVLNDFKTANPPLYSLLKKAEPRFTDDSLTLAFSFKLHQIKMEDAKNRTKLIECINRLGYACPALVIIHDVATTQQPATAEDKTPPNTPVDETAASVLAMMGGGDIVNA